MHARACLDRRLGFAATLVTILVPYASPRESPRRDDSHGKYIYEPSLEPRLSSLCLFLSCADFSSSWLSLSRTLSLLGACPLSTIHGCRGRGFSSKWDVLLLLGNERDSRGWNFQCAASFGWERLKLQWDWSFSLYAGGSFYKWTRLIRISRGSIWDLTSMQNLEVKFPQLACR